jgi:putative hydrolase of the HAD superfamily
MRPPFDRVETWVFDLDNTLYPPSMRLFDQIERRMTDWVVRQLGVAEAEADRLRLHWWDTHGTTLAGLMREHGTDADAFLDHVHDIDFAPLTPDPGLRAALAALPGRRIVYTNGTAPYAQRVTAARGIADLFDAFYGVEHAGHHPKPEERAFRAVFGQDGLDPARAAMFEDDARNLFVPAQMGLVTIHVAPRRGEGAHVQHHAPDLAAFLRDIPAGGPAGGPEARAP